MSCNRETPSGRPHVSAGDPKVEPQPVVGLVEEAPGDLEILGDPNVEPQAVVGVVEDVIGDPEVEPQAVVGVFEEARGDLEILGDPNVEPQAVVGVVEDVLGDPEAAVPQDVVEVPEEEDFSLEVLVVMAIVAFASITMLLSYPFGGLSFWYRFGAWAVIFSALWLVLIIWWIRNNGDRRLLNRVLRQIRGI
jgi:hypothetical protein